MLHAHDVWFASEIIIVGAPENVTLLRDTVNPYCESYQWVVQPRPIGVVDAISRGVRVAQHQMILILCADNTFQYDDGHQLREAVRNLQPVFGVRNDIAIEAAARFTRYKTRRLDVSTHNGPATLDNGVELIEAGEIVPSEGCWIGPLLLGHEELDSAVSHAPEASVVEMIKLATQDGRTLKPIEMRCEDFGVLEMHQ